MINTMRTVTFIIGAYAPGRSRYIKEHYSDKDVDILDNIYDYQQRVFDEALEDYNKLAC